MIKESELRVNITTLVTFNVRGFQVGGVSFRTRMKLFAKRLETMDVDELHLQEVYTFRQLTYVKKLLRGSLPFAAYIKGSIGPRAGLVSFYAVKPQAAAFHPLPASRAARFDPLRSIPYFHKGILASTTGSGERRYNLHLDPDHSGEWKVDSVASLLISWQLDVVIERIIRDMQASRSAIVLGDFNLPTDTDLYARFTAQLGFVDAMHGDMRPTYQAAFLPPGRRPRQIDHVLIHPNSIRVEQSELVFQDAIGGAYVSDHVGIRVALQYSNIHETDPTTDE